MKKTEVKNKSGEIVTASEIKRAIKATSSIGSCNTCPFGGKKIYLCDWDTLYNAYMTIDDKTYKDSDSFQAATDRIKEQHKDESRNVCNAVLSLFKNALSLHNKEKFSIE